MKQNLLETILTLINSSEISEQEKVKLARYILKKEKYGLTWVDKPEYKDVKNKITIEEFLKENKPYLQEETSLSFKKNNGAFNYLIEGDNLETLLALYACDDEFIDLIYIDPPYNTGKNDFTYNDRFVDKADPDIHSKWLSSLKKRISLAKKLLKSTGMIVVSIGKDEIANLQILMNEIFGEENLMSCLVKETSGGKADSMYFADRHEYLLVYRKSKNVNYVHEKTFSNEKEQVLSKWGDTSDYLDRPNMFYPIYVNKKTNKIKVSDYDTKISAKGDPEKTKQNIKKMQEFEAEFFSKIEDTHYQIWPFYRKKNLNKNFNGYWRWDKKEIEKNNHKITLKQNKNFGNYLYEIIPENDNKNVKRSTVLPKFSTGGPDLVKILGSKEGFSYPKSVDYMKYILGFVNPNAVVLDFFAGSGTVAQAVVEKNNEDGGNRRFIIATNNESGICREVTYQRLKKVADGYEFFEKNKKQIADPIPFNLKYFVIDYFKVNVDNRKTIKESKKILYSILKYKENLFEDMVSGDNFSIGGNKDNMFVFIRDQDLLTDSEIIKIENLILANTTIYVYALNDISSRILKKFKKYNILSIPLIFLSKYDKIGEDI